MNDKKDDNELEYDVPQIGEEYKYLKNPYDKAGFDVHLKLKDGNQNRRKSYIMASDWDMEREKSPYASPTLISKGKLDVQAGGSVTFYDTTGGTVIFTYDPASGSITFGGPITLEQTLNLGTLTQTTLTGTTTITGKITGGTIGTQTVQSLSGGTYTNPTINNATIGTSALTGGTLNPGKYQFGGTAGTSGTIGYLTNGTVPGTITITGGLITNWS